ncbi:MAG TPA: hypothetical protein VGD37_36055 [Kofleriaceae bacterium]
MKIDLNRDWTEFLCALIAHRVRFVMIGGHAVAAHGEPRLTEDLDVFVEPTAANARRVRAALVDFGFGAAAPSLKLLAARDKVFMLGRKPWRVDILTGIDGVSFREAWAGRVKVAFVASPLFVIGRRALIKNKRAAGRAKDLSDVEQLEALPPPARARASGGRKRRTKPTARRAVSRGPITSR